MFKKFHLHKTLYNIFNTKNNVLPLFVINDRVRVFAPKTQVASRDHGITCPSAGRPGNDSAPPAHDLVVRWITPLATDVGVRCWRARGRPSLLVRPGTTAHAGRPGREGSSWTLSLRATNTGLRGSHSSREIAPGASHLGEMDHAHRDRRLCPVLACAWETTTARAPWHHGPRRSSGPGRLVLGPFLASNKHGVTRESQFSGDGARG